jgi:FAD/FMN-containing dehydrogenase
LQSLPIVPAAAFVLEGFRDAVEGEDGVDGRLFVLLQGTEVIVERATRDLRSALGRAGVPEAVLSDDNSLNAFQRVLDATIEIVGERSATYRIYAHPVEADARAAAVRDVAVRHQFLYDCIVDAMNGDIFLRVKDRDARAFDSRVEIFDDELHELEPGATLVASRSAMRGQLQVWGARPNGFEKMQALKKHFDPKRVLNPGRFVGGL